jgi:CO/xanthine dehydrogenase Mo-binding subunit
VGETIGAVVATSPQIAKHGASLVKIDYEELPACITIEV